MYMFRGTDQLASSNTTTVVFELTVGSLWGQVLTVSLSLLEWEIASYGGSITTLVNGVFVANLYSFWKR